jgi:sugar/nucleoside kinase (ribokinase family)
LRHGAGGTVLGEGSSLVINSPKSVPLARLASDLARARGAQQFSVLTGSLPCEETFNVLLARDQASLCNLDEFAQLARKLDVACPTDENDAEPEDVARAMQTFSEQTATGHLVVTLGPQGAVVFDRQTKIVRHVCLRRRHHKTVQAWVEREPHLVNAVGDHFTAAFVFTYASSKARSRRLTEAVRWASINAVKRIAPQLEPRRSWFSVTVLLEPPSHDTDSHQTSAPHYPLGPVPNPPLNADRV